MPPTMDRPDEDVGNLRWVDCDTPYDMDKGRWCIGSHIAWEGKVLALYKVPMELKLYD